MDLDKFKDVDLVIDHANDNTFIPKKFVSVGDVKGRTLTVQITNNGVAGALPGIAMTAVWTNKASGITDMSAFELIDAGNSIFRLTYPSYMLTAGKVEMTLQVLYNGQTTTLKTFEIAVQAVNGVFSALIESQQFSALTQALANVNQYDSKIAKNANNISILSESTSAKFNDVETKKAGKNEMISGLAQKVDKGGNEQITAKMLSQEVKTMMTGGSVAVVGEGAVNTSNIADNAVTVDKLSTDLENILVKSTKIANKVIASIDDATKEIVYVDKSSQSVFEIPILNTGKIIIKCLPIEVGQFLVCADSSKKGTYRRTYNEMPSLNRAGYSYSSANSELTIDCKLVKETSSDDYVYIAFNNTSEKDIYAKGLNTFDLEEMLSINTENIVNQPEKSLDELAEELFKTKFTKLRKGELLAGYDTTTHKPLPVANPNYAILEIEIINHNGLINLNNTTVSTGQKFLLEDSNENVFLNYGWNTNPNFVKTTGDLMTIDLTSIDIRTAKIYVGYAIADVVKLSADAKKALAVSDVFDWAFEKEMDELTDDNLNVPNYVPLVSGTESYIYFDNLLIGKNIYEVPMPITAINRIEDKVVLKQTANTTQSITFDNKKTVNIPIKSIDKNVGSGKSLKVMVIGESTSESIDYLTALKSYFDNDVIEVEFVGTRGSLVKHEARSGWASGTLRYVANANNASNSFYNPATKEFDLDYYYAQNPSVPIPDIILLNFGINDVNAYVTNGTTFSQTEHYNFFINQFKAKNPNVITIVGLSHSFNRWSNYWNERNRDTIMKRTKQTNTDFRNKEASRIFLNPMYVCIDMRWDFSYKEIQRNQFDTTNKVIIGDNNVHPAKSGYQNTALMTYNAIKYAVSSLN